MGSRRAKAVAGAPDTKLVESAKASVVLDVVSFRGGEWKKIFSGPRVALYEKYVPFSEIAAAYDGTYNHLYGEQKLDDIDAKFSPLTISGRRVGTSETPVGVTLAVRADPKLIMGRPINIKQHNKDITIICLVNNKEGKKGKFVHMCGGMPCCATSYGPSAHMSPMRLYDVGMCHLAVPDVHLYGKNKDYGNSEIKERDVESSVHDTKFVNSSMPVADKSAPVNVYVEAALKVEDRVSQGGNLVETRVEPMHVFSKNLYDLSLSYMAKPVFSWDDLYVVLTCAVEPGKTVDSYFPDNNGILIDMWYVPVMVMHSDHPHHLAPQQQHVGHIKRLLANVAQSI
jgi:hypothetical protein